MNKIVKRALVVILVIFVIIAAVLTLKLAVIDYTADKHSQGAVTDASSEKVVYEDDVTTGFKREHVMADWKTLNQSYIPNYLSGFAVPMDGTNGNPDYLVPGQIEDMIGDQLGDDGSNFLRLGRSLIINTDYIYVIDIAKQQLILSDCSGCYHELSASREVLIKLKAYIESIREYYNEQK